MRAYLAAMSLCALGTLGISRPAKAGDRFYVLIFGSESDPKKLRNSHTFATFVRATGEGADPSTSAVTAHTISWVPRSLDVRINRVHPEPGLNLDLASTLRFVYHDHQNVTMWGPYLITPEIYNRSIEEYNKLNSGQELYRSVDGPINNKISDCIHAVGEVDPRFGRRHYALDKIGKPASAYIAQQIVRRSQFDHSLYDNRWLIPRLGLTNYPIEFVDSRGTAHLPQYEVQSFKSRLRLTHRD
jgi:hypothetical protein